MAFKSFSCPKAREDLNEPDVPPQEGSAEAALKEYNSIVVSVEKQLLDPPFSIAANAAQAID